MNGSSANISFTYDLGGSKQYIIMFKRGMELYYYRFLANNEKDILNFVSNYYKSKAYLTRERGKVRIILLSDPSVGIFFVE